MTSSYQDKKIAIVVDAFYPTKTSAAIQIYDLSIALKKLGIKITVFVPNSEISKNIYIDNIKNIEVVNMKTPKIKKISFIRRAINEIYMPFAMIRLYKFYYTKKNTFDGVIWYSPSIFISIFAGYLSRKSNCKTYLILRDIFPKWSVDMGIINKWGLPNLMFKLFENNQYKIANNIGIQSEGDFDYFNAYKKHISKKVHVLNNWLSAPQTVDCDIRLSETKLQNRKIFIYSGNIGLAQNIPLFLKSVKELEYRTDIGFVIIGDGSEYDYVKSYISNNRLSNIILFPSIPHEHLPSLYTQCHFGLILLDLDLKTHNIPGKLLSYLHAGLSIFASVNKGNDLEKIFDEYRLGIYSSSNDRNVVASEMIKLASHPYDKELNFKKNSALLDEKFSPDMTANKILKSLFS